MVWLVVGGILGVESGAVIAKGLFGLGALHGHGVDAAGDLGADPPRRGPASFRGRSRRDWTVALAFGTALMTMNWAIYQSFAEIPLGVAVTIEFLGPLTVAVIGSRRPRDLIWVGLAGLGVALLGFSPVGLTLRGALFALLAAAAWAAYILLSKQTGARWPGLSGLAIASLVGFVVLAPPAIIEAGAVLLSPQVLIIGVTVGLLSSVIPYSLELTALRRITPRLFGILMSWSRPPPRWPR